MYLHKGGKEGQAPEEEVRLGNKVEQAEWDTIVEPTELGARVEPVTRMKLVVQGAWVKLVGQGATAE